MAEVIKVSEERLPELRLIGKRYRNQDRDSAGGFGSKWGEWFEKGYFAQLEELGLSPQIDQSPLGFMRSEGEFEYWIGMFFPKDTPVPEGFMSLDLPSGTIGTCWIYGRNDSGELYGMEAHNMCVERILEQGRRIPEHPVVFERYNCPRFTTPDAHGNVILDYCIYLA